MTPRNTGIAMKAIGIIPARFASSRFPGKPISDICGKPMIWWVYETVKKIPQLDELVIAIDDERIKEVCEKHSMRYIMTSSDHETGTDRVVEVSKTIDADLYVVIMGDEPLIKPEDVEVLIKSTFASNCAASMLTTKFKDPVDVVNTTTIKIALNDEDEVIFMSRLPIPFPKSKIGYDYYKNIGAYAFKREALDVYDKTKKGRIEAAEDAEMLRLIERHLIVKAVVVDSDSMSVDTPKDLERIRDIISNKNVKSHGK
jgi:CMP-2-keto-3-deoxyoctulosonic acid synthetase